MNINIHDCIGPWEILSVLKVEQTSCVAIVKRGCESIEWVLKISDNDNEIKNILKYDIQRHEFGIKMPESDASGIYKKWHWFVMEKCKCDCSALVKNSIHIGSFIECIIGFLKYIHRTHKVIHGDLKINNILQNNTIYKVCDFETMTVPSNKSLCNETNSDYYYYYGYGAEYNKPVDSYRYDLQALGSALVFIDNESKLLQFQHLAFYYYRNRFKLNYFDNLKRLRDVVTMSEKTKAYFKIVEIIDWFSPEPPPESVYDEIIALYSSVSKDNSNA